MPNFRLAASGSQPKRDSGSHWQGQVGHQPGTETERGQAGLFGPLGPGEGPGTQGALRETPQVHGGHAGGSGAVAAAGAVFARTNRGDGPPGGTTDGEPRADIPAHPGG